MAALAAIALTGCESSLKEVQTGVHVRGVNSIEKLCIEGVSYYFYFNSALAVAIDEKTLKPQICKL